MKTTITAITDEQIAELHAEAARLDEAECRAGHGARKHFVTMIYCGLARGVISSLVTTPEQARARCAEIYNARLLTVLLILGGH